MGKKSSCHPKEGVVYECYRGFTDERGDRARRGQKFVFGHSYLDGDVSLRRSSGYGSNIIIHEDKFAAHFCPAAEKKTVVDITTVGPAPTQSQVDVQAVLVSGTWDDVKKSWDDIPTFVQELILKAQPDLFKSTEPKAFEFKEEGNKFGVGRGDKNVPFIVGRGLVSNEDRMKCLVVDNGWKVELFESPGGLQCIRFVEEKS